MFEILVTCHLTSNAKVHIGPLCHIILCFAEMCFILVECTAPVQTCFQQLGVRLNRYIRVHGVVYVSGAFKPAIKWCATLLGEKTFCRSCVVILQSTLSGSKLIDSRQLHRSPLLWLGRHEISIIVFQNVLGHILTLTLPLLLNLVNLSSHRQSASCFYHNYFLI